MHSLSHIQLRKVARAWRIKGFTWVYADRDMDSLTDSPRAWCSLKTGICRAQGKSKGEGHPKSTQRVCLFCTLLQPRSPLQCFHGLTQHSLHTLHVAQLGTGVLERAARPEETQQKETRIVPIHPVCSMCSFMPYIGCLYIVNFQQPLLFWKVSVIDDKQYGLYRNKGCL